MHYLGINTTNNPNCIFNINIQLTKFYSSVHSVLMQCGSTNELVLFEILKTKCAPILFYGIDASSINNNNKQAISKTWNWAIRAVFGLRGRESTKLLFKYCNLLSADYKIDLSQLNLLSSEFEKAC